MSDPQKVRIGISAVASRDQSAIEVALGAGGHGVFVTFISIHGKRQLTVGLGSQQACELANLLSAVAAASDVNSAASDV